MSFPNLPRELLFEIAYQLDDAGMNALCRTNRQIYDSLNGYLYRRDLTRLVCRSLFWVCRSLSCDQNNWGVKATQLEATVQRAIATGRHLDHIPAEQYGYILHFAAFHGYTGMVELLLNEVQGINCDLNLGYALEAAVFYGNAAVVELLLAVPNFDPNIDIRDTRYPRGGSFNDQSSHILVFSARKGNDAIVKLLLDHPDIDPRVLNTLPNLDNVRKPLSVDKRWRRSSQTGRLYGTE
ncbi:hypothetical protein V8E54_015205 [Elaphomyces granulatus]